MQEHDLVRWYRGEAESTVASRGQVRNSRCGIGNGDKLKWSKKDKRMEKINRVPDYAKQSIKTSGRKAFFQTCSFKAKSHIIRMILLSAYHLKSHLIRV